MSRTRINSKWLSNCTGDELKQMNRLRFKGDSMMHEDVLCAKNNRGKMRVFLLKQDGVIIGWSVALLPLTKTEFKKDYRYPTSPGTPYAPIYTYVHSKQRKKGYGRRLLIQASKFVVTKRKSPCVFFWNEASSSFFSGVSCAFPALEVFDVESWWDLFRLF